jgi:hypothetical protein
MKPPPTWRLKPRSHRIKRTTKIVQSILNLLRSFRRTVRWSLASLRTIAQVGEGAARNRLINFDLLEAGLRRYKIAANREVGSRQGEGGAL